MTIQPPKATKAARLRVSTPAHPWQLNPQRVVVLSTGLEKYLVEKEGGS